MHWRCFYLLVPIFGQDNGFLLVIDGVRKEKERLTAAKLLHGPSFLLFIGSSSLIMCYSQSLFSCFIVSFSWSLQLMLESLCLGSSFIFLFKIGNYNSVESLLHYFSCLNYFLFILFIVVTGRILEIKREPTIKGRDVSSNMRVQKLFQFYLISFCFLLFLFSFHNLSL